MLNNHRRIYLKGYLYGKSIDQKTEERTQQESECFYSTAIIKYIIVASSKAATACVSFVSILRQLIIHLCCY